MMRLNHTPSRQARGPAIPMPVLLLLLMLLLLVLIMVLRLLMVLRTPTAARYLIPALPLLLLPWLLLRRVRLLLLLLLLTGVLPVAGLRLLLILLLWLLLILVLVVILVLVLIVVVAVAAKNVQQLLHQAYPVGHGDDALPSTPATTLQSTERPVGERGQSGGVKVICRSNQNQYTARLFRGTLHFSRQHYWRPGFAGG